ncbi:restriction endonuclease subunit S [Bacillus atrophaeus]|uniref:restriction endonuclease subunit S n=2 Tax=Bacillus atrophaeus TaxID=1452 RepID=UPI002280A207|nr:restriction endonuclease subunit S [Bacillus atrophaeus]MCY7946529.1 restriction endonuclease subunit S [Bacillus atrophaeus]MCY8838974.1 restriction endonuclease subunit S [Bacillus atrophaeus]MCY9170104.1 restriction endonuclease subunit S [Bacillus atrophaeus]MEC0742702.1 restriction endonuclease subunit S [Bacillus atrophaeus]MEC0743984.1 restriction endonuclease subunit S [Bacillus atrophaeus]
MSKKKKNIEELLEEAVVPDEEQPYEVPENWVWTKLGCVFEQVKEQIQPTGNEKYIGLEHMNKGGGILEVGNTEGVKSKKVVFKKNDVLYGKLRPYLNKHAHVEFDGVASTDILVYRNKNIRANKLLNMYLGLPQVLQYANENSNGINLPRVSPKAMDNMHFPLPPLSEQKRIADKVERLLSKIEEAKQLIEEAKETFELRRAAILDKAFRGELTRKWRRTNVNIEDAEILYSKIKESKRGKRKKTKEINVDELRYSIPSNWKWVRLGDVFTITSGGTPKKTVPEFYDGNIPWVKTGEIKWNYIYESVEKITPDAVANSSAKILPKNSVLVAMYGQGLTRGRASILGIEATCNQAVCALLPNDYILPEFLYYYFMEGYQRFRQIAKGGNQENLSATVISEFIFPLPPLEEQGVIVDIVQGIFTKESMIQEVIEMNIDHLKQSILSKAFRGELGTNDLSEESAIELLKEVLQEQVK